MTYQESDYDSIPPVITQARLNRILADFWATVSGFSPTGSFVDPFTYVISKIGADYYANSGSQTLFGGPDDAGGVDGASAIAVITAALNASGSIRLKANTTFPLTAKLSLTDTHNYVSIRGEGRSSVLQLACNDDLVYILGDVPPDTATHITLSDLTLDGNKAAYPAGKNALYIKHSMYDTFQNLWIKNAVEDGVHFENAQRSIFNNIFIKDCDGEGFYGYNIGGETILSNMWIAESGLNGIKLDSANYVQGTNIFSVASGYHGMLLAHTGDYACSFNTFNNVHCLNNGVDSAGTYDGVHLDNAILGCEFNHLVCYDDQETKTQRYAFLETSSTSQKNKAVLVGSCYGNLLGRGAVCSPTSQLTFDELPVQFEDHFLGQGLSALWHTSDGDAVIAPIDEGASGVARFTTNNATNAYARIDFNTIRQFKIAKYPYMACLFKLNQLEDCEVLIGIINAADTFIALEYTPTVSANWQLLVSDGGATTRVDTSLAASTGWTICSLDMFASDRVNLFINAVPITIATVTTNIPTDMCEPFVQIKTKADASKVLEVDWLKIQQFGNIE